MFENLSNNLERAIKNLKGQGKITEISIASTSKEIRRALIQADVNYKLAKQITDKIKENALGSKVLAAVSPGQLFTKIVSDELARIMGGEQVSLNLSGKPAIILMVGLQGSGKTTFSAKLALHLKKQNKNVLLAACDIYRPAAIEQLQILGEQVGVEVYSEPENRQVVAIAEHAIQHARATNKQVVIIDTAGRQAIDEALMQELRSLKDSIHPSEILFVVDAMTGQDAVNTAQVFHEQLHFDGVILTKLDGDSRGGAALSIRATVNKPIKLIGIGEKMEALQVFHPERMAKRILGMGDVISLVERAEQAYSEEESRKLHQKLRKNQFDLDDLYKQFQQLKKMGNIKDLIAMVPGMNDVTKQLDKLDKDPIKEFETIIQSMTPQERAHPELLNQRRRERIAKGSGSSIQAVNRLLKQFDTMRQLIKTAQKGGGMRNMFGMSKWNKIGN